MPDAHRLNVVDEQGNIFGEETRETIHRKGLLHREAHVWFYTPRGELIFQHRAKDKDTSPDLLDTTVGGHVEIGADYLGTALKEVSEETGLILKPDDLTSLLTGQTVSHDVVTGATNNVLRAVYAYRYAGRLEDLRVEDGVSQGFEAWPIERVLNVPDTERRRFIPSIFAPAQFEIFRKIQRLLSTNAP